MTADLSALIARLEAAEVGSRELDAHVEVAVRGFEAAKTGLSPEHWAVWRASSSGIVGDGATQYASAAVTTSLDAALALAERVLKGWAWEIRLEESGASVQAAPVWWMEGLAAPDEGGVSCEAAAPALALCLAVLKAANHVE
ncbi:hypothetical protein [Brevundimonas diminuta]